jgi:hypothetical protein
VRPLLRRQAEPAREVRVEHVEPARAEAEIGGLDVDEHLVADRDRAGEVRVRDARSPVHAQAHETVGALDDVRDRPAGERQHRR